MALPDYAQKRRERVGVRSQTAVGVFAILTARDFLLLRGSASIPAVLSDFVPSEEVRLTRDVDQLLRRKKPPGEFSFRTYFKVPTTPGRASQWTALMRNRFGIEQRVLTVLDFATLESANATVTVTIDGTAHVLTEDAEWQAAGSNSAAATSLAAAINGLSGVAAVADGAAVLVTLDEGTGEVTIATSAAATVLSINLIRYRFTGDTLERLLTLVHSTHTAVDWFRDCIVSKVDVVVTGQNEAELVWSGWLGNGVTAGMTRLASAIDDLNASSAPRDATDPVTFQLEDACLQVGPTAEDFVLLTIGSEVFKVPYDGWDPDTKTVTGALGCQAGSSPAAHAIADEVLPYLPGADPDANDLIIGLTLGEFAFGGVARRIVSHTLTLDEKIIPRIDEAFEATLTGYLAPEAREIGGPILERQRQGQFDETLFGEREKEAVATLRLGRATGPRAIFTLPHARIGRAEKGEADGEFTRTLPMTGLASAAGDDGCTLDVYTA